MTVLTKRRKPFIHTHHYDYITDYFQSSLAQFPHRAGESFMHQYLPTMEEEAFQEPNPVPKKFVGVLYGSIQTMLGFMGKKQGRPNGRKVYGCDKAFR